MLASTFRRRKLSDAEALALPSKTADEQKDLTSFWLQALSSWWGRSLGDNHPFLLLAFLLDSQTQTSVPVRETSVSVNFQDSH